jgi:hypothetical protein
VAQPTLWAGIDVGKAAHHCVAMNADGQRVLSRRVVNDEGALLELIRAVKARRRCGSMGDRSEFRRRGAVDHAVARRRASEILSTRRARVPTVGHNRVILNA